MKIVGVGVDIVEIGRIEAAIKKHSGFVERLFTPSEEVYCRSKKKPHLHFAVRFSAKEAVLKALGTGLKGMSWKEMEVVKEANGRPCIRLSGNAARRAEDLGIEEILVSLSYGKGNAIASAIAVGKDKG